MRLVLALLALGLVALGFLFLADRPTASRRSTVRGPEPVQAAQVRTEEERAPPAPVSRSAAELEAQAPTPADDFPRSLLTGRVQRSDRKPVAGVALEVRAQGQRGRPHPLARLRSGEDGSFEVRVLGSGPFRVETCAESGGDERLVAAVEPVTSEFEAVLELPRSGRVHGCVVDDRGEPVRAFTLEFRREDEDESGRVRASFESADGLFETEELAEGLWHFFATAAGYGPSSRWISVPESRPCKVRLLRACRLSGVVRGSDGVPRAGARVELSSALEPVFADANGAFSISGGGGQVYLRATDPSAVEGAPFELTVLPGEERAGIVLVLGASGRVSGRVVTIGNRPAAGRSVSFRPLPAGERETNPPPTFTDALGRFLVDLPPGQWEASVVLDEREIEAMELAAPSEKRPPEVRSSEKVQVRAGEKSEVWLALAPAPVRVSGALTKAGEPCQGGKVEAVEHPSLLQYRARVEGASYAFGLGCPGLYEFRITFGETVQVVWVDVPATGEHELDLDVPVGWIEGFVRAQDGARFADVAVWAITPPEMEGGGAGHALTDADGTFVLELAPGTYDISVGDEQERQRPWGRVRGLEVKEGERYKGLELVLPRDPAIQALEVVLRGPRGERIEGGRVEVSMPAMSVPQVRSAAAPLGSASFGTLPSSQIEIMAEAPGYFLARPLCVRLEWPKPKRFDLSMERALEVVVRVRSGGATGPLHGLDAVATSGLVFPSSPVDADVLPGEPGFRWPLLPVGEYRVRVFAGGEILERPLRVGAEAAGPASLEISVP